ncbi:RNA 2'-phosphotransferase [Desulforegula conservatrix]|uniref:RNA 2'-phosphotransferase n=1 Tax=Desulforegula conservatrix TaxID=153026 RepID=UPI00040E03F7|nr:RNA 2'-phosphotransferase [Desulforegula conservatrix]
MNHSKNVKQIEKFLFYVLGKRPDEFGILLDIDGFIKITDLARAISEEDGYRFIRDSHIREVLISSNESLFETSDDRIRAIDRSGIEKFENTIPKLLYYAVKKRTYGHILEKGIYPDHGNSHIALSSDQSMALRIGKRKDRHPVLLTIPTTIASDKGVDLSRIGENLYASRHIPASCIIGPPLEKIIGTQTKKDAPKPSPKAEITNPGSFLMKPVEGNSKKREKGDWKNSKKRLRKEKMNSWPDE